MMKCMPLNPELKLLHVKADLFSEWCFNFQN